MLRNVYDRWEEKRDEQFLSLLDRSRDAKVVDLGCGDGSFTKIVGRRIGTECLYGVDTWSTGLKEATQRDITTVRSNLDEPLDVPNDSFDVVVSNQVIEHLFRPVQFLEEINRILRDNGYLVLSTENLSSWDNVAALALGETPFSMEFDEYAKLGNRFSSHNRSESTSYPPHTRIFSYRGLLEALKVTGFDVDAVEASGYLPFSFLSEVDPVHARFLTVRATPRVAGTYDGPVRQDSPSHSRLSTATAFYRWVVE